MPQTVHHDLNLLSDRLQQHPSDIIRDAVSQYVHYHLSQVPKKTIAK